MNKIKKKLFIFIAVLFTLTEVSFSQKKASFFSVDLSLFNNIGYHPQKDNEENRSGFFYSIFGDNKLFFKKNKKNVKGEFALRFLFSNNSFNLSIQKAFVKVKFNRVKLTLGKSLFLWGEGEYYNAGDLLFLNNTHNINLSSNNTSFRNNNTRWLSSLNVSIDPFSFFEAILLAPNYTVSQFLKSNPTPMPLSTQTTPSDTQYPPISDTSVGYRFFFTTLGVQNQIGYMFTGTKQTHQPYYSMHIGIANILDYTFATSVTIDAKDLDSHQVKDNWILSTGFFYPIKINDRSNIQLRLELQFIPFALWTSDDSSTSNSLNRPYAQNMFFSIIYNIDNWNLIFRNLYSPIDNSSQFILLVYWNVYQGLSLNTGYTIEAGEKNDKYSYYRNGTNFIFGARYIF